MFLCLLFAVILNWLLVNSTYSYFYTFFFRLVWGLMDWQVFKMMFHMFMIIQVKLALEYGFSISIRFFYLCTYDS